MAKTQQKYYWPNFDEITLTDPVSGQSVPYRQFMFFLASSFEGIGIDLKEGQMENAAKHHADFDKRQQALKENCAACHDTDRKYFVDESVQTMINRLGDALASGSPDANNVSNLCQGIGMESCYKCHAVHMPSALANDGWKTSRVVHGK